MSAYDNDLPVMAEAHRPSITSANMAKDGTVTAYDSQSDTNSSSEPTMEEMKTLRRVSGKLNWQMMTVTFVEFCERFSYYGTTGT